MTNYRIGVRRQSIQETPTQEKSLSQTELFSLYHFVFSCKITRREKQKANKQKTQTLAIL